MKLIYYTTERVVDDAKTGNAVRIFRKRHGVSQGILCGRLGFTQPMLCALESGKKYRWTAALVARCEASILKLSNGARAEKTIRNGRALAK